MTNEDWTRFRETQTEARLNLELMIKYVNDPMYYSQDDENRKLLDKGLKRMLENTNKLLELQIEFKEG